MTKKEFLKRYNLMIADLGPWLRGFAQAALDSGAVDLKNADSMILPKNVLSAGLLRAGSAAGYGPMEHERKSIKEIKKVRANVPLSFPYKRHARR